MRYSIIEGCIRQSTGKPINKMRTTKKQLRESPPTIEEMRYDLAEQEAMNMNTSDIINMLLDGFEGLENMSAEEIKYEWEAIFFHDSKD